MATPTRRISVSNAAARAQRQAPEEQPPRKAVLSSRQRKMEQGRGFISTSVKDRTGPYHEASKELTVTEVVFEENEHPAFVKVGAGLTINMQNFESLRIDCAVTLPCHARDIQATFDFASNFVADRITEEEVSWLGSAKIQKR